jgi:nucleoid-associated protein YgaU
MSAGTKIFLAFFGVLIAALVAYYTTSAGDSPEPPIVRGAEDPLVSGRTATGTGAAPRLVQERGSAAQRSGQTPSKPAAKPAGSTPERMAAGRPSGSSGSAAGSSVPPRERDGGTPEPPATSEESRLLARHPPLSGEVREKKPAEQPAAGSTAEARPSRPPTSGETTSGPLRAMRTTRLPAGGGAAASSRTPAPRYVDYFVKPGDTMSSIAGVWFGDVDKWDLIAKANPMVDPNRLKPGDLLRLPPKSGAPEPPAPPAASPDGTHVVRSGETLSSIAGRVYGDENAWRALFDANRALIGPDPDRLEVGMKLKVPKRP